MIYSAGEDDLKIVETNGFWIGLEDEIGDMLLNDKLSLNKGDVMLLYTDGITEAWQEADIPDEKDSAVDMYGEARLEKIFKKSCKKSGNKPIKKIKDSILKSLEGYICDDNVTFVLLRKV